MSINLSVKNVPDALADKLRERAARNHRSLQRELLLILERATQEAPAAWAGATGPDAGRISIEQLGMRARQLFPKGTTSSVPFIRKQRDERLAAASSGARRRGR
jgi:plasmid stability protein